MVHLTPGHISVCKIPLPSLIAGIAVSYSNNTYAPPHLAAYPLATNAPLAVTTTACMFCILWTCMVCMLCVIDRTKCEGIKQRLSVN